MKRYALFGYDRYYPTGGWDDFVCSYDSLEDAVSSFPDRDYKQIVDLQTGEVVYLSFKGKVLKEPIAA